MIYESRILTMNLNTIWKPKCVNGLKILNKLDLFNHTADGPSIRHLISFPGLLLECDMKHNNDIPFSEICNTDMQHNWRKMQLIWSEWKKSSVQSWGGSLIPACYASFHTICEWWSWWPTIQLYCVWWVLSGVALFCLLTALLPVLGLADAEVSPRWLIVYCHLSAWPPVCHVATCYRDLGLWGGNGKLEGGAEEMREGEVYSGVVSRVCLNSSVAVSNIDHG